MNISHQSSYKACFDVKYHDKHAVIGYVLFDDVGSGTPYRTGHITHNEVHPYIPGEFYKRELPCLLTAFHSIEENIDLIFVDAYVWLGEHKKGLGVYLYEALEEKIPVIGISKTNFHNAGNTTQTVLHGNSESPLYVSAIGMNLYDAARMVKNLHGTYRLPTMIKLADTLSRV